MKTYDLYWSPEGRRIATVHARTMKAAIRKAPKPYRRYLGEIYAILGAKCGECNGTGKLTRLGGDWGKTPDTEVTCWACKGSGKS